MWPFPNRSLFPPPTQAWLQTVSSDPEAQGWGAWNETKEIVGPEGGEEKQEEDEAEEDQDGDAGFLLSLLEQENLAECPVPDQELEAIRMKVCAMEQAKGPPRPPGVQQQAEEEEGTAAGQLLSPETMGCPVPGTPEEKVEADHRSVYVGNVDYGGSAEELEAHFSRCGEVHRVTILCDKFSGHPKGYAYIEFATKGSVQAAVELDQSLFRGRLIKVLPKRTNFPGISSTDRGGLRGHPGSRGAPFPHSSLQGRPRLRPRGQNRARGKFSPWFSPY
ncbi:embryonic polyadenylate-binding protein 2 isoform X1 [Symphalangus syndactylus]|uniref:embryonic polyadenylate-binding protein 2 isoform X1 n=2 Tax=Symphalangus syndactylus TaxID=9590 RepID=UPI00244151CE|nr:embryonic polyadenylate-binding protein 2 isoform X1 [Symphalangus syndactylus]